jgi:electron transfer flavoprotein beta subunit
MKAIDDDLQAVGPMVAELLELPSATVVTEFSVEDGKVTAHREIEGGTRSSS